jgi:hypothetical protein
MWCGLDGLIGCEESLVQWSDVKKAIIYYDVHPSNIDPPHPTPQDVCFLLVWGGEARTDGWTGWSDRTWRKFIYCDKLQGCCYVHPSNHFLETCKLFSFSERNFFCFFCCFWGPPLFLPLFVSSGDCNNYGFIIGNFLVCNLSWTGSDMWKRLVLKDFNVEFCPSTRRFRPSSPPTFPPI